jgi:hypothetical protein
MEVTQLGLELHEGLRGALGLFFIDEEDDDCVPAPLAKV